MEYTKDRQTASAPRTYRGIAGLAELPYFEMTGEGLLRLTVDDLGAGIDGHVHFAMSALDGPKPNLLARQLSTKYFLDAESPISLDNYMGQNQTERDISNMVENLLGMITPGGSPFAATHTIPNLIAEMDLLGIEKAVVLPIAFGFPYGDDMSDWYMDAIEKSGKKDRFIVCAGAKPTLTDAPEKARRFKVRGFKGIKLHPNMGVFKPNDRLAWAFYEECSALGLPVLIHCGLVGKESPEAEKEYGYTGRHADVNNFREPARDFPTLRFVFCHSGALQNDLAVEIARSCPNVWMDVQGQSVKNIQTMIRELGPERLMFGSDWPFFAEASLLARLLLATEQDKAVRKMIFAENARLFWQL